MKGPLVPSQAYFVVGGDASKAWSGAAGSYVTDYPDAMAFPVASEDDLSDVLRRYGLPVPKPMMVDYQNAVQALIDATAQQRQYDHGWAMAGYVSDPEYGGEARAFVNWRSEVWRYAYQELAKVQNGQRGQPSVAEFIQELPKIAWP